MHFVLYKNTYDGSKKEASGMMQFLRWKGICGALALFLTSFALPVEADNAQVVAVAASMAPALESILEHQKSEKGPGESLEMVTSASGKLARQIEGGAPYGIFLSANEKWVRYLEEKGLLEDAGPLVDSPPFYATLPGPA